MFIATLTPTAPAALTSLVAKMSDLIDQAAQRDREAYLSAERRFQADVGQANAEYGRCLLALSKERQERRTKVRQVRCKVDTVERDRFERLRQLDSWVEAERDAAAQQVQQQAQEAAAGLAYAQRQREILTDKVDSARALINQYDDLAFQLAEVDDQILAAVEHELTKAELTYQVTLAQQADRITSGLRVVEEAYRTAKDGIMVQSQADCQLAIAEELELIQQLKVLAISDRAVVTHLREERQAAITTARSKFEEACLWHSDGKAAVEAEREAEQVELARARAQMAAESIRAVESQAKAKAEIERRAQAEAQPAMIEINNLYSARRIAEIVAAAKKHLSSEAAQFVQQAAQNRKSFVGEVRQLLSEYPRRPDDCIELITPHFAGLFTSKGDLIEIWSIADGAFAVGDETTRRKFTGWKPGRIFNQAKQPGCVAFKCAAS